jgi:hypothetical protein
LSVDGTRPRKSKLSDSELENFFNGLAFLTRKANETSFTRTDLNRYGLEAIRLVGLNANIDKVLADIIDVTCLILAEGEERRFIHKSVQEYHAALFIKDQPDATAIAFYNAMNTRWHLWVQELQFLEIIDRYRFLKYFHIPQLRALLGLRPGASQNVTLTKELLADRCGKDELSLKQSDIRERSITVLSTGHHWPTSRFGEASRRYANDFFTLDFSRLDRSKVRADRTMSKISVRELLDSDDYGAATETICRTFLQRLIPELEDAEKYVKQVDERKEAFTF